MDSKQDRIVKAIKFTKIQSESASSSNARGSIRALTVFVNLVSFRDFYHIADVCITERTWSDEIWIKQQIGWMGSIRLVPIIVLEIGMYS